jgi:hypothetical protein
MDENLCKTTIKLRNYNKMSTNVGNGDGDAAVDDKDDGQASKDPSPFPSCVVAVCPNDVAATAMEAAERHGSAEAVAMEWFLSLGSSSLYIGSKRTPNDPLVVSYDLGNILERTWVKSVKKHVCSRGFCCPEPAVWLHCMAGYGRTCARQSF